MQVAPMMNVTPIQTVLPNSDNAGDIFAILRAIRTIEPSQLLHDHVFG